LSYFRVAFFFIIINILLYAKVFITNETNEQNYIDILPQSNIYVDNTRALNISVIQGLTDVFEKTNEISLSYGYSPNFDVWIQFTLTNQTNKPVTKILEYDNPLTTNIEFYDPKSTLHPIKEGMFSVQENRKTIKPIFKIYLEAQESKTYYIKASSYITTLIVKLNLWEMDTFYEKEMQHQNILVFFFSAMFILALYNLFIYFFTKDQSYLYYVFYIFGILMHQFFYVGLSNIYIKEPEVIINIIKYASFIVGIPALALGLFTRSFLQTEQYPRLHKILNIYLWAFPILLTVFVLTDQLNQFRNIFPVIMLIILISITSYATWKRNRQAYFLLFGWIVFFSSGMLMYLSSAGIYNFYESFPYYIEVALVIEAIVFSIALADKIKQLQQDKNKANQLLIQQQKDEQKKLQTLVHQKTIHLEDALNDRELLLKELNHRVKNNMQTIVSLIRLQSDDVEDKELKNILQTIQNRINAMSHLHQLLYSEQHDNVMFVNANEYFSLLIEELKSSFEESNVLIKYNIQSNLKTEEAVYCGLIINELVTNSFKHAFEKNTQGKIYISLKKENNNYLLNYKDNGKCFDKNIKKNTLGLLLIDILVTSQLKGTISTDCIKGLDVNIQWSTDEQ